MEIKKFEESAELLKLLGHPARLCILIGILEQKNKGCNVSYMQSCLGIPQSTVSQHIAKLKAHGLIKGERKGLEIEYQIIDSRVEQVIQSLNLLT